MEFLQRKFTLLHASLLSLANSHSEHDADEDGCTDERYTYCSCTVAKIRISVVVQIPNTLIRVLLDVVAVCLKIERRHYLILFAKKEYRS